MTTISIAVDSFTAEYYGCGSHLILLTVKMSEEEFEEFKKGLEKDGQERLR